MANLAHWRQKRVLVTGATGFIGRHLVRRLREMDAEIYACTPPTHNPSPPAGLSQYPGRPLALDVRDASAVRDALAIAAPDIVFHLAAVGATNPGVDPMLALKVNTGGAINLLEGLRDGGLDRIVLVGTSYEYGLCGTSKQLDPCNAYAASKVAAWAFGRMYWRACELPVVTVRPFQVYGPGQPDHALIPAATTAALSGDDFPMTRGEQRRDFIYTEDVVDGMIAAAESAGVDGKSLDLGTGIGTPIRCVVEHIWELTEAEGSLRPGARPYRTGAAVHLVADADQTAQLTGWRAATPLERGLRITVNRLRSEVQPAT